MKLSELKLNPDNPRNIKQEKLEKLAQSIKDFPKMMVKRPIVYDENKVIIGGNMRYRAIQLLEMTEIPDEWTSDASDFTPKERERFIMQDNAEMGEHDWDMVANQYDLEDLEAWGIDVPHVKFEEEVEEDDPPDPNDGKPSISKLGEVYKLGRHRVMCGNSTSIDEVSKLMDGNKACMVFTDPPYNVDYGNTMKDKLRHKAGTSQGRTILNDKFENNEQFYQFLYDSISAFRPFVNGDVYIAMSSSELHTLQKAFMDCGGHWSTFIIWVKNQFTIGRSNYQRQYEPILYGWFEGSSHYWAGARNLGDVIRPQDAIEDLEGNILLKADNLSMDVWEFPKPSKNKEHPTMKPIALCARGIVNSSKKKDIVLDTFSGSGSTLIACEQTDRTCYGMELDPKYVDVIRKRYWKFTHDGNEDGWDEGTPSVA